MGAGKGSSGLSGRGVPQSTLSTKLAARARSPGFSAAEADALRQAVRQELLAKSARVREPNFTELHADDLRLLFDAYDERFLSGLCRRAVAPGTISFRLSRRMTRTAGQAALRRRHGSAAPDYEVAVSSFLLFDGFGPDADGATVAGLPCADRLDALQRILEHEFVHVVEMAATGRSSCGKRPFREMAQALFGHREFTHELLTRRARAARRGIVAGSQVVFDYKGRRLAGKVNRVTKRATVLVPHSRGRLYSDNRRYAKYYVPVEALRPA